MINKDITKNIHKTIEDNNFAGFKQIVSNIGNFDTILLDIVTIQGIDSKYIEFLIQEGANVNATDDEYNSVLQKTITAQNINIIKLLLDKNANLNASDMWGGTAFTNAIISNNITILEMLLKAVPSEEQQAKINSLLAEAARNSINVVEWLINQKADVNARDVYGTALKNAIDSNKKDIIQLLLDKGADVELTDDWGNTVFTIAIITNNITILEMLLKAVPSEEKQAKINSLLVKVFEGKINIDVVKCLIDHKADVNVRDNISNTLLAKAIASHNTEIVQLLLNNGADVELPDNWGNNAFKNAINSNNITILEMLLAVVPIEEKQTKINSLLIEAVQYKRYEAVNYLINNNANINLIVDGETIFAKAIYTKDIEIIRLFLDKGVNVNEDNQFNNTYFLKALSTNSLEVMQLLIDRGADLNAGDNNKNALNIVIEDINQYNVEIDRLMNNPEEHLEVVDEQALQQQQNLNDKIQSALSIIKLLLSNGIKIVIEGLNINNDIKFLLDSARIADSIINNQKIDYNLIKEIDLEIFCSRFNHYLENNNFEFHQFNAITNNFQEIYKNYIGDYGPYNYDYENIKKIIINKYWAYFENEGFNPDYMNHLKNAPAFVQKELTDFLTQAQKDFNLECASLFHFMFNIAPVSLDLCVDAVGDMAEINKKLSSENSDDQSTLVKSESSNILANLIEFYNNNSDLKTEYLDDFLAGKITEDKSLFEEKLTAANIQIISKKVLENIDKNCVDELKNILLEIMPNVLRNEIMGSLIQYHNEKMKTLGQHHDIVDPFLEFGLSPLGDSEDKPGS